MEENENPPIEGSGVENHDFNEIECDHKLSKQLKDYAIKLLKSMKGFGKTMILWLISKGRIHGYELMGKLNEINPSVNKKMKGGPGKIYPILHDLENEGLIKGTWESHGKRNVKYYDITDEGIQTLDRIRTVFRCHRTPILEEFWRDMFKRKEE